jgi:HTH-type transcriptional regulator, glycine betaine synthesis regulator
VTLPDTSTPDEAHSQADGVDQLAQELVEAMGRFFEGFGFRRHLGRVWMTLYLSSEPMTQSHLQTELRLSAGMVSTLLRELGTWNAVRTRTMPASRQVWYEAETDLLAYVTRILKRRDLPHVQELDREISRIVALLEQRDDVESRRIRRRLRPVRQLAALYDTMSTLVIRLAEGPADSIRRGIRLVQDLRVDAPRSPSDAP